MLVKFEAKTSPVKGLSFHPKRPWILASLHSGTIVLWNYHLNICLEKYEGHDGPVRGLSFHRQQPLFVSGGDDCCVKVWNYLQHRCLFTLLGHTDYIRTTSFHSSHPWILSASDDHTIRIWNWQNRTMIALLSGHSHYVMCAEFHPTKNLIISGSLDETICIWDISGVINRHTSVKSTPTQQTGRKNTTMKIELFGKTDYAPQFIIQGHDKGINWVTFHPTLPLCLTGSDDCSIKLWRMDDNKILHEVDNFRGHNNNVTSVLFHPRQSILFSVSEDKSLRTWDMKRKSSFPTHHRSHERFWIAAAHPSKNLFAAGHDSGLMIFKLERERPAWTMYQNSLFYIREKCLYRYDLISGQYASLMRLFQEERETYSNLSYSEAKNSILLSSNESYYYLYTIPFQKEVSMIPDATVWKKSFGQHACWIGRNRFAVLLNEDCIVIKTSNNEVYKTIQVPFNCHKIFPAEKETIIIQKQPNRVDMDKTMPSVVLYDLQQNKVLAQVKTTCFIKHIVWSKDKSYLSLVGKSAIILCDKNLDVCTSYIETDKVKSGVWREPSSKVGIFIYNTHTHLKYIFTNGETGTIRSLDVPIYIVSLVDDRMLCLDRDAKLCQFTVDTMEPLIKLALTTGNYSQFLDMIRNCKLVGQSIVSYFYQKGYSEIALRLLQKQDERTRFSLALECCNVATALECAHFLDTPSVWNKLAERALLLGNLQIVESCYQKTKNVAKLSFLYLITGNKEKLKKLQRQISVQGKYVSEQYWIALVTGDLQSQINLLRNSTMLLTNEMTLGYQLVDITRKAHSAIRLLDNTSTNELNRNQHCLSPPIHPPSPLIEKHEDWPLLEVSKIHDEF